MKKLLLILAAVALSFSTAWAQSSVSVGGHAAVNFGTLYGDEYIEDIPWGLGFNAGIATKLALGPGFLVPELDFELRRESNDDETLTGTIINIPIMYRYNVIPNIHLLAGPSLGIILGLSEDEFDYDDFLNTIEFGLVFGAGATVMPKLDVEFRFALGLTSWFDKLDGLEIDAYNLQLSAGVTYWFM